ncbi:hypothetical protein BDV19DRAFT_375878 [Aspergillus venezuelensis]
MDAIDRLQSGLFFHYAGDHGVRDITHTKALVRQVRHDSNTAVPGFTRTPQPPSIQDNTPQCPLPLLSISVDVDASGRLYTTKVAQGFSNASTKPLQDANYVFLLYSGAVVTSFRCVKAAVLIEELTPEIFKTNVGNIPAQTTIWVEIVYITLLKIDNTTGGLALTIPTSIAPRYGVAPEGYRAQQDLLTDGLRISIQASMPAAIRKMKSRSHPISVEVGAVAHKSFEDFAAGVSSEMFNPTKARATLVDRSGILEPDFILHILSGSRELTRSRAVVVPQPEDPAASTIAITLHPGDLFVQNVDTEDFDGEIIFMVDRSGSMASKTNSLISKCEFNIVSFGSRVSWMWPAFQPYTQASLDTATKQVGTLQANLDGTEIYSVLKSVQEHHDSARGVLTNVILLTDGEVWDVGNVIELVKSMSSNPDMNTRFFSLGIGDHERVIQMLKAALTPSRFQCEIDLGQQLVNRLYEKESSGCIVKRPGMLQAPYHIPVMSTFSHLSVHYMVDGEMQVTFPASITVSATTDKGKKLTAQLPLQMAKEPQAAHHLAAKALMNDYESGQSWLHAFNPALNTNNPAAFEELLKKEAQDLGTKWSIISKWTSYVAIDRTTAKQHEISVRKAAAAEENQLTRARYQRQRYRKGLSSSFGEGSAIGVQRNPLGSYKHDSNFDSSFFCPEPINSMPTRKFTMSVFTREDKLAPGLSLDNIIYTQTANGEFKLLGTGPNKALLEECQTKALDQFMDSLLHKTTAPAQLIQIQEQKHDAAKLHSIRLNILAVVYIIDQHPETKALWELQVLKVRGWIRRAIKALLGHENVSEIFLDELEASIIEELHSKRNQVDEGTVAQQ